ncbi:MAG: tetratricopeptide repeat protein [bacterium]|nr:tetratricopeptide repeat protein [bacterium]
MNNIFMSVKCRTFICMIGLLLLVGCSKEYMAERMCWYANKLYAQIIKNPDKSSEYEVKMTIGAFQDILRIYPEWDNASQLQFNIANIYFLKKKYPQARKEFKNLQDKYPEQINMCLQAQMSIGRTYEMEKKWDKALVCYQKIITDYPVSYPTLQLLCYIADYYDAYKQDDKAQEAYVQAINHYERLIKDYTGTQVEATAWEFILDIYKKQKQYDKTVETLQRIINAHPESNRAAVALYEMAAMYLDVLKKPEEAFGYYKSFVVKYPEHKLVQSANTKMESIAMSFPQLGLKPPIRKRIVE